MTVVAALAAAAQAAQARVAPSTTVATLLAGHKAYKSPGGAYQESVPSTRPITTETTVLPVLTVRMHGGRKWLLVRLPGRPNSHTGWIKAAGTRIGKEYWHIVISTGQRRAWIYFKGHLRRNWLVVVGAPNAPTPTGEFFVEENIQEPSNFPGNPYALATSGRSNVFSEFDGGPGQVALHGMGGGLTATPGTAVSHGCIRLPNDEITWLAQRIAPGTPVTITG
jgi:lipoprotein-anchoring transpeptidase ErfK/SrfK